MNTKHTLGKFAPRRHFPYLGYAYLAILLGLIVAGSRVEVKYEFISPLVDGTWETSVKEVKAAESQTVIENIKVAEIVDRIWVLESSRGKAKEGLAVYCKEQGMSNEYGYGGMALKLCFRNHKEATAMIHLWFNTQLETKTLEQAICYYNTGTVLNTCDYLTNYREVL